ncbi:MAG TPA: M23 family metallopeptidase [Rhodocyclaceae bacterium]|nr:M23 family metallopeptidase [Rhodocyclaceae bacterium]
MRTVAALVIDFDEFCSAHLDLHESSRADPHRIGGSCVFRRARYCWRTRMAFVILSAGTVTRSKMRTLSVGAFVGLVLASMLLVLAGGFALGYTLGRDTTHGLVVTDAEDAYVEADVPAEPRREYGGAIAAGLPEREPPAEASLVSVAPEGAIPAENRYLIDRFGELSGRMVQLEAEAIELAARIGAIKEFEARINSDELQAGAKGRVAKTPPGAPAGGPLLRPLASRSGTPVAPQGALPEADELDDVLAHLDGEMLRLADVLDEIDRVATAYNLAHMSFPGRQPVDGFSITSGFGNRSDPFTRRRAFHSGVDFPAPKGTPIHASAGGRVIFAGRRSQYGYTVEIDHGGGLATRYAHASKLLVKRGQVVMPGDQIALVGSTGRSTGPHLHFEILKDGRFVDPSVYLARF